MRFKDIQRDLCIRSGATPEDILKSAFLQEKGAQTTSSFQKKIWEFDTFGHIKIAGQGSSSHRGRGAGRRRGALSIKKWN